MYFSSTVALSFFYQVFKFVGVSAETLLVYLINVLDLHVVIIAKLYVTNNLNFEFGLFVNTFTPNIQSP